jgi:hypothetical protein
MTTPQPIPCRHCGGDIALAAELVAAVRSQLARKAIRARWSKPGAQEARSAEMKAVWALIKTHKEEEAAPTRRPGRRKGKP